MAGGPRRPSSPVEDTAGGAGSAGAGGLESARAGPQTVLIVEDDEAISDSIAYALDRAGYRTLRAGDGGQGLRLFRQQRPDLVILDLMLPAGGRVAGHRGAAPRGPARPR